jgi:hypothetical protein
MWRKLPSPVKMRDFIEFRPHLVTADAEQKAAQIDVFITIGFEVETKGRVKERSDPTPDLHSPR